MIEVIPGSCVYWYPSQKQFVDSKSTNYSQLSVNVLSVFFTKEVLQESNAKGGGTKYKQLNPQITEALISLCFYNFMLITNCF